MTTRATAATSPMPHRPDESHRVAPWWMGYLFLLPVRRFIEPPGRLLDPWIRPGDRVLEFGCGMGYFTLPLARRVGPTGRVVAVDLQPRVLAVLARRARRAGLADRVAPRTGAPDDPRCDDLDGAVDVVHAHHALHEAVDPARVAGRLVAALRPGGLFLLAEPRGHVSAALFAWECDRLREAGCEEVARPQASRQQIAVFRRVAGASGRPLPAPAGPATLPADPSPPALSQETPSC